jgi:hypothetical protein
VSGYLHSISYNELPNYFLLFNVRDCSGDSPIWLSWDEVEMWAEEIGAQTVPVLFKGIVDSEIDLQKLVETLMLQPSKCGGVREGVVVRVQSEFSENDFSKYVLKCVRANHVNPGDDHWKHKEIIKNLLYNK